MGDTFTFAPMLLSPIPETAFVDGNVYDDDDGFSYEQKVDGDRRLVFQVDGIVHPLNKDGNPTTLPPSMIHVLGTQQIDFAVDGELIGTGADKRLVVFDLPWVDGMVNMQTPFHKRRAALETLYENLLLHAGNIDLIPIARTPTEKRWLRRSLYANHAEGAVIKHVNHPYLPGRRSRQALKVKWRKTVDCFVTGLGIDGHDNIGLGVYDTNGEIVDVGEVTAQAGDGARIVALCRRDDTPPNSVVVEVTCLYATEKDKLYGPPTLPKLRVDKRPEDCTLDQLDVIRENKTLLRFEQGRNRRAAGH